VKCEQLEDFLENALHTKRFARYIGRRRRGSSMKDVAEEKCLSWHTVKRLKMQYTCASSFCGLVSRDPR
jgi:hypothetical protein